MSYQHTILSPCYSLFDRKCCVGVRGDFSANIEEAIETQCQTPNVSEIMQRGLIVKDTLSLFSGKSRCGSKEPYRTGSSFLCFLSLPYLTTESFDAGHNNLTR